MDKVLSIIIPVFNEATTIEELIDKVISVKLNYHLGKEIIIIDDASTDNSAVLIGKFIEKNNHQNITFKVQEKN